MLLKDYFPNADGMLAPLKAKGEAYGVTFNAITHMPNTNKALQLAEYAKSIGKSEAFTKVMYDAVFVKDINISSIDALIKLAGKVSISKEEVEKVFSTDHYKNILEANIAFCHANNISSVPTFIINDQIAIVGAQSPSAFVQAFEQLSSGKKSLF